jgi:ribosomal protein S18 acetylase RimI-like enzyme
MYSNYEIRPIEPAELSFAAACTAGEGWVSEDLAFLTGFYQYDSQGFLIARRGNEPLGICVATFYGQCGFVGELIVAPDARKQGLGTALLEHAIAYLQGRGAGSIYLDGVLEAVPMYERNGFRKLHRSLRFEVKPGEKSLLHAPEARVHSTDIHGSIRRLELSDLPAVCDLDCQAFGADRGFFIRRSLERYPRLCLVHVIEDRVLGFILGRQGPGWCFAGPWVVHPDNPDPGSLLESLAGISGSNTLSLGILETNQAAVTYITSKGFSPALDSPWRMVLGLDGKLGVSTQCYAIGSPAKG